MDVVRGHIKEDVVSGSHQGGCYGGHIKEDVVRGGHIKEDVVRGGHIKEDVMGVISRRM